MLFMISGFRRSRPSHAIYNFEIQAIAPFPCCLWFWDSGERAFSMLSMILGFRQGAVSMLFIFWLSGDRAISMLPMISGFRRSRPFHVVYNFRTQAKRSLHAVYGLSFQPKRRLHAAYDFGIQAKCSLHAVYNFGFESRTGTVSMVFIF
jgi:hypothetical protein